jgi:hypothetical protein
VLDKPLQMPSRIEIDRSTGLVRRWLQYAFYDWTREMPKSVAEKDKERR